MITETNRNGTPARVSQPAGQPPWLMAFRAAIAKTITTEAIEEMLEAQVTKAKKGDSKALKLVMELASHGQSAASQPVNATQNVFHVHLPEERSVDDPLRVKIYAFLEAMGPHSAGEIAANIGVDPATVEDSLDHPWFLSGKGRHGIKSYTIARRR